MRKIVPYNPKLKKLARELRNRGTQSEVILWQYLKGRQISGYDFHRQKPLGNFIVDFFCSDLFLAIEIDGITHEVKQEDDRRRQKILESLGVTILRFYDDDVKSNVEGVVAAIQEWIEKNGKHTPSPSPEGRKKLKSHF